MFELLDSTTFSNGNIHIRLIKDDKHVINIVSTLEKTHMRKRFKFSQSSKHPFTNILGFVPNSYIQPLFNVLIEKFAIAYKHDLNIVIENSGITTYCLGGMLNLILLKDQFKHTFSVRTNEYFELLHVIDSMYSLEEHQLELHNYPFYLYLIKFN